MPGRGQLRDIDLLERLAAVRAEPEAGLPAVPVADVPALPVAILPAAPLCIPPVPFAVVPALFVPPVEVVDCMPAAELESVGLLLLPHATATPTRARATAVVIVRFIFFFLRGDSELDVTHESGFGRCEPRRTFTWPATASELSVHGQRHACACCASSRRQWRRLSMESPPGG